MSQFVATPSGQTVETVTWDTFLSDHFVWRQGEHVSMIGPTGSGKTTLALNLLPMRQFVIVLATKPRDETMDKLVKEDGYLKVKRWKDIPRIGVRQHLRVIVQPPYKSSRDIWQQAQAFDDVLNAAFIQGGWTIFADELFWMQKLGLNNELETYWTQGRSMNLSLIAGTQRPANVSLFAYDQATHVFFWRDNDERNLKRISGMNGQNAKLIRETVASMPKHASLYVNTRTGAMVMTTAPRRK